MPKRRSDAGSRIFFDELVSIAASRLRATGAIRLEDRLGVIAFEDKQSSSASPIPFSETAAHGPFSSARDAAAGKRSSG
jgi:hypothetical protein